jgi:hypothetical protein
MKMKNFVPLSENKRYPNSLKIFSLAEVENIVPVLSGHHLVRGYLNI